MSSLFQILVLAGVALFLVVKLRAVLGTREGFERPPAAAPERPGGLAPVLSQEAPPEAEAADRDILDHVAEGSPSAAALAAMKKAEPGFSLTAFLQGARGAYEMILLAFDRGDMEALRPLLDEELETSFAEAVDARAAKGLVIETSFGGVREIAVQEARFDPASGEAEITLRLKAELIRVVKDAKGKIVEGGPDSVSRQRDLWTFARKMGAADPNWQLVATEG